MDPPSLEALLERLEAGETPEELNQRHGGRLDLPLLRRAAELLSLLAEARLEAVPERTRRAVRRIPGREQRSPGGLRQLVARLLPPAGPVPAFRGGTGQVGHRLYRAGDYDVDVCLLPGGSLVGQILSGGEEAPPLDEGTCVLHGGDAPQEAALTDEGEFRFPGVGPGAYTLIVEAGGTRLIVPELRFEEPELEP